MTIKPSFLRQSTINTVSQSSSYSFHQRGVREGKAPHMSQDAGQRSADVYGQRLRVCFAYKRRYIIYPLIIITSLVIA